MTDDKETTPEVTYKDDDLVYVDAKNRKVVGLVKWKKEGIVEPLEMTDAPDDEHDDEEETPKKGKRGRSKKKRYYPWGSYRSMKKLYRIEGKQKDVENYKKFDEALELALNEPFWD